MKSLKSWELFESNENIDEVISVVRDMLLELDFDDIQSECGRYYGDKSSIYLTISKPTNRVKKVCTNGVCRLGDPSFTYDDIRGVIETIIDYLESEGFVIDTSKASGSRMSSDGGFELVINSSKIGPVSYLGLIFNPIR